MNGFRIPIFLRLFIFAAVFTSAIAVLTATTIAALAQANRNTEELQQKWLAGATLLGEIEYSLSAFRLDESYRALMSDAASREFATGLAASQRRDTDHLIRQYTNLLGPLLSTPDFAAFTQTWATYQASHDAWIASDTQGLIDEPGFYGSALDRQYLATDAALAHLANLQQQAANARARDVAAITQRTAVTAGAISTGAFILSILLLLGIRHQIVQPLGRITRTLGLLANGQHQIKIPGLHRKDEIGAIAAACEAFRLNVLELDQAHEETRAAKERAYRLARHDALTGLPNRRVFAAELDSALARAQSGGLPATIFLIDLDEFKKVNDLQGHPVGDAVLCEIGRRLEAVMRKQDTVARLGGDEFAIITESEAELQPQLDAAMRLAGRIIAAIRQPICAGESKIKIGASIGIATCRADATDVDSLLRAADIAMYRAKESGRSTFRFFEQSMDDEMREQEALERDLAAAISHGEIKPYYQPLVDIADNHIRGFEALARWNHPTRGFIPPDVFVPIVEQLGLMPDMTNSMLRQACRDARHWPEDIRIAVNFSPSEFKDPHLPERIIAISEQAGMAPARLEIEITETALVSDIEGTKKIINSLQALGMTVCLDDFGTGYSSLYHLRELKFDKIKIDRSFVQSMELNPGSEKIVDAILSLSSSLNLPTVAEGIESPALRALLSTKGCKYGQGYFYGKAMPAAQAADLIIAGIPPINPQMEPARLATAMLAT
jgi:diguanylate cyclase (GGDEF)-like protein